MHLLTGAYAVGALDPLEQAAFEEHLAGCGACAAEVRGLLEASARLGSAEALTPPPRLKESVLAKIASTGQLQASTPAEAEDTPAPQAVVSDSVAVDSDDRAVVVPLGRPGWGAAQRWLAVAAAVAALVAVGLGTLLVQSNNARSQLDATQQAVTRVLTAADATSLSGSMASGGKATVVVSASEGTAVFLGSDVQPAPAGHTYQLWYVGGAHSAPAPAGTFDPDSGGHVATVLSGPVGGAAAIAVTVEPAGGSLQPTTKPVMAVKLPS